MPNEQEQLAVTSPRASEALAAFIGMAPAMMIETIKAQCFRGKDEPTDFQVAAFISIAHEMRVNPLLPDMLYALPISGGGVIPVLGPSGVFKKLAENPAIESWEVEVFPIDVSLPPTHATAKIHRKGIEKPITYTALLSEWKISQNPNWNSRPRHMLQLRALKHAARQLIHGMPGDSDDAVIIQQEINVTPGAGAQTQPEAEKRADPAALRKGRQKNTGASAASPTEGAIDVQTTVAEAKAADAGVKITEGAKPAEASATPSIPAGPAGTLVPLEDKKKYTLKGVKVVSSEYENYPKDGKPRHGAKAVVSSPQYSGPVIHLAGGREVGTANGIVQKVIEAWAPGTTVTLEVRGAFSPSKQAVLCMVDAITVETEEEGAP
jgi:hypothetical protein